MYYKKYSIRWADLDSNGHLAHSSYQKITADTRLSLFYENGVLITEVLKKGVGSVLFYEQISYLKECLFAEEIYITSELIGLSKEYEFFKFRHRIYKKDGTHAYTSEVMGAWIDLTSRKLASPPKEILEILKNLKKSSDYKNITETRLNGIKSVNIAPFWKE